MYKYETHLHSFPVSRCGKADVRNHMEFYKSMGYDGIFITNHFLDGNINISADTPYAEKIEFYCSDYENALKLAPEIGIKVFFGVELSYKGTDFLVYGLDKNWFLNHPEIMDMKKSEQLPFLMSEGALVIQAHPYREAGYIDHIRLFPGCVHGVEVINASNTSFANEMAKRYAKAYNLLEIAGSDNHFGDKCQKLAGVLFDKPIVSENDFVEKVKAGRAKIFFDIPNDDDIIPYIQNNLVSMADEKYKDFSSKLMPTVDESKVLGVRIPALRKFAKSLDNYDKFLNTLPHEYFEEDNLHAFLIEREKDFDACVKKLNAFLPYVNNWATCDSLKPKVLKDHPKELIRHINTWIKSDNTYTVRYAINLLMTYYLDDLFKEEYLKMVAGVKSDEYYVNMMRAWYFATALAKQYQKTLPYIENKVLDLWTHRKAIQKAAESFRITKEQKEYLKKLK